MITFGLGYYFSDFYQNQNFETSNYISTDESILNSNAYQQNSGTPLNQSITRSFHSDIDSFKPGTVEFNEDSNGNNSLIFKLFRSKKDIFSINSDIPGNPNGISSGKKNKTDKKANQLLIDTLLFKKENLSERGFLLNEDEKKTGKSRWSFGTKFSPVYSMAENVSQPEAQKNAPILKSGKSVFTPNTKADEKSLLAFSGGVNVNYYFAKRWSIESGLFYSQQRQKADNLVGSSVDGIQDEMMVYTPEGTRSIQQTGIIETSAPEVLGTAEDETYYSLDMEYMRNFDYIELPILVRYKIIDSRFGLDILSGVSTNFLVGTKTSLIYNDNDLWSGQLDGISPMLYNATIGLGFNYNIYQNISLNIEPTFKYSMFQEQSQSFLKYPYSFAVFAGFSFRF
jgi:hypothetical protein